MPWSRKEMQQTYSMLHENAWMQIIDGKYHRYGPEVFDQGLHGGPVEPGFLDSLQKGMSFVHKHLGEPMTIDVYKQMHQILCHHFKGQENETRMNGDEAGEFRYKAEDEDILFSSKISYFCGQDATQDKHYYDLKNEIDHTVEMYSDIDISLDTKYVIGFLFWITKLPKIMKFQNHVKEFINSIYTEGIKGDDLSDLNIFLEGELSEDEQITAITEFVEKNPGDDLANYLNEKFKSLPSNYRRHEANFMNKKEILTNEAKKLGQKLDLKDKYGYAGDGVPFIIKTAGFIDPTFRCRQNINSITIYYQIHGKEELEEAVEKCFNLFYKEISAIENSRDNNEVKKDNKLEAIAKLYQALEWLHPFPDGQGRTDLLVLSKLLTEHGFHPVIMDDPYFSTYHPLNEWVTYLKDGLTRWENAMNNQPRSTLD